MAVNEELVGFVREALVRRVPRSEIEQALQRGGWTKEQTRAALDAFVDTDFPLPVPRARPYLSAREAFQYLLLFATLYTSAYCLGSLVFDFINAAFPDPSQNLGEYRESVRDGMRWGRVNAHRGVSGVSVCLVAHRPRDPARSRQSAHRRFVAG